MSQEGNICRTTAQQALSMRIPCIQITPAVTRNLDDWAKIYYLFKQRVEQVEETLGIPITINIVDCCHRECESSPDGIHKMADIDHKNKTLLMCIHCGKTSHKSSKTRTELEKYFEEKQFRTMPKAPEYDLPF